jgi:hypothetical protein
MLAADPIITCPGAEGKVCLVHFGDKDIGDWHVSNKAEESGCIGVIAFIEGYAGPSSNADSPLLIPYVYIEKEDGMKLVENKIGSNAIEHVEVFGAACHALQLDRCRENWPCDDGNYCEYNDRPAGSDIYNEGNCKLCPKDANGSPNPLACYFDENTFSYHTFDTVQNVESCALSCAAVAALRSESCKFCPDDLTKFRFGISSEENRCIFCPQNDLQYPNRTISLFGDDITCHQMERFFQRLPVSKDSSNCKLAQSMNYICGCGGIGYAGANTDTKQAVLAWLPRVAAILSLLVSCFITDMIHRLSLDFSHSSLLRNIQCLGLIVHHI